MTLKDLARELNMFLSKNPAFSNEDFFILVSNEENGLFIEVNDKMLTVKGGELVKVKLFEEEGAGE